MECTEYNEVTKYNRLRKPGKERENIRLGAESRKERKKVATTTRNHDTER